MKRHARKTAGAVLDFILPPRCLACGQGVETNGTLCAGCWGELEFITAPCCDNCGVPLPDVIPHSTVCPECSASPPPFARARAALVYKGPLHRLVTRYKYHDQLQATPLFTRWMQVAGESFLKEADIIAPVPLHWWRMFRRRYNQAAELARALAATTTAAYHPMLLARKRHTRPQASLSRAGRQQNVRGAFGLRKQQDAAIIKGKTILLVDDVMTTGATVSACAKALKKAGAKKILVLTIARTTLEG